MQNQPNSYDAVYGSQPVSPHNGVVLGGLEGVRQQLNAPYESVRVAALHKALDYGEAGLDLVIEVMWDNLQDLSWQAHRLLGQCPEAKAKESINYHDTRSERGIDYTRLCDLLKAGQWYEADEETYEVMLHAVGRKPYDWLSRDELLNFPYTDLITINRLWVRYSHGKFGFSVQNRIYMACGAKLDGQHPGDEIWHEFCKRVGWREGSSYTYYRNLKANLSYSPDGEFPGIRGGGGGWVMTGGSWRLSCLLQRLMICSTS